MKSSKTFSILFWINTSRAKNNQVEIYARITVDGKRVNISLKRKVNVENGTSQKNVSMAQVLKPNKPIGI